MAISDSGIFTKTEFQNRGVIKLAPDILVYIGGNQALRVLAPVSSNSSEYKISFNDGITSVSVQNNVDPPGSSTANIEVVTPIYGETSKYWVSYPSSMNRAITVRHSIFLPMMEVKIFMKGRYIVNGVPRYYPVFWGLINSVDESFSGGVFKISIQCGDILSWLDKSTMNVHPVPESKIAAGGGQKLTVYATIFEKANPYTIVYDMLHKFFDIDKDDPANFLSNFVTPQWVGQRTHYSYNYPPEQFKLAMQGLGNYWRARFNGIGTNLKMFGMSGKSVDSMGNIMPHFVAPNNHDYDNPHDAASGPKNVFDIDSKLREYIPLADYEKMGNFQTAEYQTKLQILTEVKNRLHFELYQDVNGAFIFKPPFFNMNVSSAFPYTLYPNEILSCAFQTNSEGIITVVQTKTAMHKLLKETAMARGIGFHMDMELAAKYGIRFQEISLEYTSDANIARSLAVGELSLSNAKCFTGNITVSGRPEMKLGYPIYVVHRDSFHYVKSISHQFDYGGTCSTTLSLEAERQIRRSEDGSPTGPNKSFVFTTPFTKDDVEKDPKVPKDAKTKKNQKQPESNTKKQKEVVNPDPKTKKRLKETGQNESDLKRKDIENKSGRTVGIPAGLYEIKDSDSVYPTNTSVPLTDDNGYQLIGAFPYGRNIDPLTGEVWNSNNNFGSIVSISPSNGSEGESKKMNSVFPTNKEEEWSIPRYLDSDIIDTNMANKETSDIVPGELMDGELQISSSLIESAYTSSTTNSEVSEVDLLSISAEDTKKLLSTLSVDDLKKIGLK